MESVRATPRAFIGKTLIVDLGMHHSIRKPDCMGGMAHQLKDRKATDDGHKGAEACGPWSI
jgi:hypothetical protein